MTADDEVLTAAAQATAGVEHNYLQAAAGGPTSYAGLQVRTFVARHATRNGRPQMLHDHAHGQPCAPTCLGLLPGPPAPDRARRLIAALTQELARR
jgi:hypothetical protein